VARSYDLFVPGRVCLFGEHSDWAGGHRRVNSAILPGQVIIAGTNQGAYARVKAHPDSLVVHSTLPDGTRPPPCVLPMQPEILRREAGTGGFYSYAAGVALFIREHYPVGGLEIDNYRTTLPVRKGLSSSACFCVLVARAFSKVYDLKMPVQAEMEAAYQGEILTPSRCGRMDQGCAFGQVPVLMTFDADSIRTRQLSVGRHVPLLIADLKGQKNTVRILGELNRAYPFAESALAQGVQRCLGEFNTAIVERARRAVEEGDVAAVGRLMTEAQAAFDAHVMPACPSELTAPKLHQVLADPKVRQLVYGGKGVGSQGDGCVQFVTRGEAERRRLRAYLARRYGLDSFDLDLRPAPLVRKALIPVAGFGTRMFPASKAVRKAFFPVVTPDGMAKPVILAVIEEAVAAGIQEVGIVVRPGDERVFDDFFTQPPLQEHDGRLSDAHRRYWHEVQRLAERITYIVQEEQAGLGHAVFCAREWVGNEPVLVMLGDHLYRSDTDVPCARQLMDIYESGGGRSVVGVCEADLADVSSYGIVAGRRSGERPGWIDVREFAEKPSREYAAANLATPGLGEGRFLCVYGQYVLAPAVFAHLARQVEGDAGEAGEIQLTTALESLRQAEGVLAYRVAGRHYDTGLPLPYVRTLQAFSRPRRRPPSAHAAKARPRRAARPRQDRPR